MGVITSQIIIWYGVIFGNLDWISDLAYVDNTDFKDKTVRNACLAFILL